MKFIRGTKAHWVLDELFYCTGICKGDKVSVYVDIDGQCRKGLVKRFEGSKLFIGNGIAAVSRQDLFSDGGRIWYILLSFCSSKFAILWNTCFNEGSLIKLYLYCWDNSYLFIIFLDNNSFDFFMFQMWNSSSSVHLLQLIVNTIAMDY